MLAWRRVPYAVTIWTVASTLLLLSLILRNNIYDTQSNGARHILDCIAIASNASKITSSPRVKINATWLLRRQTLIEDAAARAARAISSATNSRSVRQPALTRVLIVGYMRGGSTLFGELFNRMSNSVYWFEPVDSFYMAQYGLKQFSQPLSLINYVDVDDRAAASEPSELTPRYLDAGELTALNDFLADLFTCNFGRLPLETFVHQFMLRSSFTFSTFKCLESFNAFSRASQCKKELTSWCSGSANFHRPKLAVAERRKCSKIIEHFRKRRPSMLAEETASELNSAIPGAFIDEQQPTTSINAEKVASGKMTSSFEQVLASNSSSLPLKAGTKMFFRHFRCLDQLNKTGFDKCIEPAGATCHEKANLIALKVVRVRISDIEPLLVRFPDLHIIHYVRDPRAIALSRVLIQQELIPRDPSAIPRKDKSSPSAISSSDADSLSKQQTDIVTALESKHLCNRMWLDILARRRLDAKYPGAFSVIRYEDLITDSRHMVSELFRRIGVAEPDEEFFRWLHGIMFRGNEGDTFDISRANATATAEKWKNRISYQLSVEMTRRCRQVLVELGYEL